MKKCGPLNLAFYVGSSSVPHALAPKMSHQPLKTFSVLASHRYILVFNESRPFRTLAWIPSLELLFLRVALGPSAFPRAVVLNTVVTGSLTILPSRFLSSIIGTYVKLQVFKVALGKCIKIISLQSECENLPNLCMLLHQSFAGMSTNNITEFLSFLQAFVYKPGCKKRGDRKLNTVKPCLVGEPTL